jgi:hypothetical protein
MTRWLIGLPVVVMLAAAAVASAGSNGIVATATGSGHATVGGEWRTFSFTARTSADGTTSGHAQFFNRAGTPTWKHLELDCLVILGSRAYVSGTVTNSSDSVYIGESGAFAVTDNGEGQGAPADVISLVFPGLGPCTAAATQIAVDTPFLNHAVEAGNIQVR